MDGNEDNREESTGLCPDEGNPLHVSLIHSELYFYGAESDETVQIALNNCETKIKFPFDLLIFSPSNPIIPACT